MNEYKHIVNSIGSLPKDETFNELLNEMADNVLAYDINNEYFTYKTDDPITGQILAEAKRKAGHSLTMDSFGHLKFLLTYGFLAMSENEEGRMAIDLKDPQYVVSLDAFGERGLGYGQMLKEQIEHINYMSDIVATEVKKKQMNPQSLKNLIEAYENLKESSVLPRHWFSTGDCSLLVEKKGALADNMDRLITEGNAEAKMLLESYMQEDEKFFTVCKNVGKTLVSFVEKVAEKIAENKGVNINLKSVEYSFVSEEAIVKQFFENQYGGFKGIMEGLRSHYNVNSDQELLKAMSQDKDL